MDDFDNDKDAWVIAVSDGTRYIGKVVPLDTSPETRHEFKEEVLGLIPDCALELNPCYEYPIFAESNEKGLRKIPLPNSVDMMLDPCPVFLTSVSRVVFFIDMSNEDRRFIELLRKSAEDATARQRAARIGLELLTKG